MQAKQIKTKQKHPKLSYSGSGYIFLKNDKMQAKPLNKATLGITTGRIHFKGLQQYRYTHIQKAIAYTVTSNRIFKKQTKQNCFQ